MGDSDGVGKIKDSAINNPEPLSLVGIKKTRDCPLAQIIMKTALFTNFSDEEFVGYWDGKPKKFKAGQSVYMPDYLAKHFAKHLVNRELLRKDVNGNPVYKDGEKFTSPKRPHDTPVFMQLFNKAFKLDENDEETLGTQGDDINALINSANKNHQSTSEEMLKESQKSKTEPQNPNEPQLIIPPDFDEDDDDESSFEGKPIDLASTENNQ